MTVIEHTITAGVIVLENLKLRERGRCSCDLMSRTKGDRNTFNMTLINPIKSQFDQLN